MDTVPAPPPAPPQPRSLPVPVAVLEVVGYAGAAAALAATGIAFDASSPMGQILLGAGVTVALLVAGLVVRGAEDALHRMSSVFWFVAVFSWAEAAGVIVGPDGADLQDKWLVVVTAALVAALAIALWVVERRSLQLIAAFVSAWICLAALAYTESTETIFGFEQQLPNLRWSALVTVAFGVAGLVLGAREMVLPTRTAMVLGALAFMTGLPLLVTDVTDLAGVAMAGGTPNLPVFFSIAAAIAVIVVGARVRVVAISGLGIVQLIASVVQLVGSNVDDTGPAIAVLVAGLGLIGVVAVLARSMRQG